MDISAVEAKSAGFISVPLLILPHLATLLCNTETPRLPFTLPPSPSLSPLCSGWVFPYAVRYCTTSFNMKHESVYYLLISLMC